MPCACVSEKKRSTNGRRRSRSTRQTLPPGTRLGDREVGGRRRLALLLDRARDEDHADVVALERGELEVRAQHPERLRARARPAARASRGGSPSRSPWAAAARARAAAARAARRSRSPTARACRARRSRTRARRRARARARGPRIALRAGVGATLVASSAGGSRSPARSGASAASAAAAPSPPATCRESDFSRPCARQVRRAWPRRRCAPWRASACRVRRDRRRRPARTTSRAAPPGRGRGP